MWWILGRVGPMLENHPLFPERANIEMAKGCGARPCDCEGVGTWCGPDQGLWHGGLCRDGGGLSHQDDRCRAAAVTLPGGDLFMSINEETGHVIMTGPLAYEYEGVMPEGLLA